jgi:hypothetical protein
MKRLLALLIAGVSWAAALQAEEQSAQAADPAAASSDTVVDAAAIQALDRMGAYLRSLKTFSVRAEDRIDEVLDSGQKIQWSAQIDLQVRRPDGLHAGIETDRGSRQIYFDGKAFTLVSPALGYYTTVPAPPTIGEMLTAIETKYGVIFPLADLFHWGVDPDASAAINSAIALGTSKIGEQMTDHYAFRQEGVDWQLWIAQGEAPLPLRYVITTMDEPEQPQYSADLTWDTQAKPADSLFTFTPTDKYSPIGIVVRDDTQAAN